MTLSDLARRVIPVGNNPLRRRDWPTTIELPTTRQGGWFGFGGKNVFWDNIQKLRHYTDSGSESFSNEHSGSTGWEYEMQVIYIDGTFVYTTPGTSKDYNSVTPGTLTLRVVSKYDEQSDALTDEFILNERTVHKSTHIGQAKINLRNKRLESGEFVYGFFAHFHSHPKVIYPNLPQPIYTFFSRQDFDAFIHSSQQVMGLVTNKLWLLGKTYEAELPEHRELHELTQIEAFKPEDYLQAASDVVSRRELVLYVADFGQHKLQRVA